MRAKLAAAWKALYDNRTFYRLFWTSIQVGSGIAAERLSGDPKVGVAVIILATVLTSEARIRLGRRGGE